MTLATGPVQCPICAEHAERKFLLRQSPHLQNVLHDDRSSALAAEGTDCPIHYCAACHFAFNPCFAASRVHYDGRYDNDQSTSPTYRLYLDAVAEQLVADCGLSPNSRVLEIACGNGYFLARIAKVCGAQALGYDPAWRGRYGSPDCIKAELFSPPPGYKADLVILRHCLDSFTDSEGVLGMLSGVLHANSRVYVESANLDFILDSHNFSLFYHECHRYFSIGALARYLHRYDLSLQSSRSLFNMQYFGCLFRPTPKWSGVQNAPERLRARLNQKKRTLLWGASGRSITMLTHLGLDEDHIAACVDIAPEKQGRHVPIARQRIISESEARAFGAERVIVANRNYLAEITAELPAEVEILTINDIVG